MTEDFTRDVCVVGGCGHVGLPLAITFAQHGLSVAIHDIDQTAVASVSAGIMPFREVAAADVLKQVVGDGLYVSTSPDIISSARVVIVTIGTPVDEHLNPTFHVMRRFFRGLVPFLRDGQTIVLRSTVYPGSTEKVRDLLAAAGLKVHVAYCPERVAEGKAMEELKTLPQIVAGCDEEAIATATTLFGRISRSIIYLEPVEAELTKMFANVWRYIQFATANQFLMIATDHGVDFYRVHHALTHEYPRMAGLPKGGFSAGPCLFKDTMQLAAATQHTFSLGHAAMLINEGLPNFIVQHVKKQFELERLSVGILGMAFKGDSDDSRESLSYKLRKILEYEDCEVLCTDAYIRDGSFLPVEEVLARAKVLILAAPHSEYRDLRFRDDQHVIDIWNFYGNGTRLTP